MSISDKPGAKERNAKRFRVLKSGLIAFNNRGSTMRCTVRDLSNDGARLVFEPGVVPPASDSIDLIIDTEGIEARCVVKWRRGREIGVSFAGLSESVHYRRQSLLPTRPQPKPTLRKAQR